MQRANRHGSVLADRLRLAQITSDGQKFGQSFAIGEVDLAPSDLSTRPAFDPDPSVSVYERLDVIRLG